MLLPGQIPQQPGNEKQSRKVHFLDFLLVPLGCLIRAPLVLLAAVTLVGLGSWLAYSNFNLDFLGLASPRLEKWEISQGFSSITNPHGKTWNIRFERKADSTFTGLVRHISPFLDLSFPMITHDILVTQGDYANKDLVHTSVFNHHYSWNARQPGDLSGSIHLLHTVPANEEINRALLEIHNGDLVEITGREILAIDSTNSNGTITSIWMDSGCNTILVTFVEFVEHEEIK